MLITVNPTYWWSDHLQKYVLVAHDGIYECDLVDRFCSGGSIGASDEEVQQAATSAAQTMYADYSTAFAEQQGVLGQQAAKLAYIAANPMGYTPQELATATTSINENTATAAKQAMGSAAAFAAAHGGADTGGGAVGEIAGQIATAATESKAQSLAALNNANQQMKRQNFWSAMSGLNQVGSEFGGAGATAAGGGSSAGNTGTSAGTGALNAQQAGWQDVGSVFSAIGGLIDPFAKMLAPKPTGS